jgi:hypothetical protein
MPIFLENAFRVTDMPLVFSLNSNALRISEFYIGYEILTPGFSTRKFVRINQNPKGTLQILDEIDA